MTKKDHRSGGKIRGTHTTLIPAARPLVDRAKACSAVSGISLGFITAGLPPVQGLQRVKIVDISDGLAISFEDRRVQRIIAVVQV